jgi:DNA primase
MYFAPAIDAPVTAKKNACVAMTFAYVIGEFCAIDDLATLVWTTNLAAVELHPFFVRADEPRNATGVLFDSTGGPADLADCCRVVVPLNSPETFDDANAYGGEVAGPLPASAPDEVVDRQAATSAAGKVLFD